MSRVPEELPGGSVDVVDESSRYAGDVGRWGLVAALAAWFALIGVALSWGHSLRARADIKVDAPPFFGRFETMVTSRVVAPVLVGLLLVAVAPALLERVAWRWVPAAMGALSVAWGVVLQRIDGTGIADPLATRYDFLAGVGRISSPLGYIRHFTERLHGYPTHVKSHPPGLVLLLWVLDRCGLGGKVPLLVLVLVAWAAAVGAVLVALRTVAGEPAARRAALPVALAPALIWVVTASDAIFAGVTAVALALVTVSLVRSRGQPARSDRLALGGGVVFGVASLLTYGAVPLLAVPGLVALRVRRLRPLLIAACGGAAVIGLAAVAGFWWPDGLAATKVEYYRGVARFRPYRYFLVADLAVFAVSCGPAVGAGIASIRRRNVDAWLLGVGAMVAVLASDLSGLSKGEVERIWLLFVPWALSGVAATTESSIPLRLLVAAQVGCAIAVPVFLRSPN